MQLALPDNYRHCYKKYSHHKCACFVTFCEDLQQLGRTIKQCTSFKERQIDFETETKRVRKTLQWIEDQSNNSGDWVIKNVKMSVCLCMCVCICMCINDTLC